MLLFFFYLLIHSASSTFHQGEPVFFQVVVLNRTLLVWVGANDARFDSLQYAMHTAVVSWCGGT